MKSTDTADSYCATEGAEVSTLDHLKDLERESREDKARREALEKLTEIEHLRLKTERQRLALYAIAHYSRQPNSMGAVSSDYHCEIRDMREIARRALRLEEEE